MSGGAHRRGVRHSTTHAVWPLQQVRHDWSPAGTVQQLGPNGWSGGAVPARRSDGSICSSALGSGVVSDTVLGWPAAGRRKNATTDGRA